MRYLNFFLALLTAMSLFSANDENTGRPLHYLSTDKQIYHPGEMVYVRDVVLDGQTNYPMEEFLNGDVRFLIKVLGPRKDEIISRRLGFEFSVGAFAWNVPDDAAGGVYTLRVENDEGAPAERTFEVRNYRAPHIRTQIDFLKRGYLPGDDVSAVLDFKRAEGDAAEAPTVSAIAIVDGKVIFEADEIPVNGTTATVTFALPKDITEGDGTLNFTVIDGGVLESAGKSIPILLDNYSVDFYPEGGDLIAGVPNRVYVEATQKNGIGADIQGRVLTKDGTEVARYASVFDGRGILEFTPAAEGEYRLVIKNEQTLKEREFTLPKPVAGAVISADKPAYDFGEAIALKVRVSDKASKLPGSIVLRKRDEEIAKVQLSEGQDSVELNAGEMEGVLIATLYAKDGTPMSERLIFRRPKFQVYTTVEGLDKDYTPGDKVKLTVFTKDNAGNPVSANVGITITDASVKDLVDRRDIAPRLPAMVYLENEVRTFADAGDYFNPDDDLAPVKIDLLLGTQGWRRFVLVRQEEIRETFEDALKRILAPKVTVYPMVVYKNAPGDGVRNAPGLLGRLFRARREKGAVMADMMVVEEEAVMVERAMPAPAAVDGMANGADEGDFAMAGAKEFGVAAAADMIPEEPVAPMMDMVAPMAEPPMVAMKGRPRRPEVYVREYAHKAREGRRPGDRVDFKETVYWAASKQTDPRTGKAEIAFELPDTVGAFQVMADAFGNNGALGEYTSELKSVQPFYAEVKLPLFMSVGDQAIVPITIVNATAEAMDNLNLALECSDKARIIEKPTFGASEALAPGERKAVFARIEALSAGSVALKVRAVAGGNSDAITRGMTVVSRLFPFAENAGASIGKNSPLVFKVTIPAEVENGSQKVTAQVYTSPAATMEAALNALLRQPHGCFEQTSSTNYPLVMAQQYFLSHAGCDSSKIKQAQDLLDEGYKKLVSFECSKKGYEWFGENPGHEALSAYGLMEFADMAKVMPVDQGMIQETREWLLNRRDGNGGFQRNERALDSFGRAPANTTDAYIVWSLLESGEKPETLKREIEAVCKKAASSDDDYLKALAANILFLAGDKAGAEKFADMLVADQQKDGTMAHPGPTITCSGSVSQNLECTSLAALAWVRCGGKYSLNTECAMKMLAEACQGGKFGSTQSTVLVLKAINAYDASFAKPKTPGEAQLWLDGKPFGTAIAFDADSKGILALPDCGLALTPGEHTLEIRLTGDSELTSSLQVEGMTTLPRNGGSVMLETSLGKDEVMEGDPLQIIVKVTNASQGDANMPLAVIAIPGGLEVQHDQLKELTKAGRIGAYEVIDNAVVLYWRGLKAGESLQVPLAMTAVIPGEYTAAASRAYLYYSDQDKQYKPGTAVKIVPKKR